MLLVGLNDEVSTINCNESTNNQKWRHVASIVFSLNSSAVVLHQCKSSYYQRLLFVTSLLSAWNWIFVPHLPHRRRLNHLFHFVGALVALGDISAALLLSFFIQIDGKTVYYSIHPSFCCLMKWFFSFCFALWFVLLKHFVCCCSFPSFNQLINTDRHF